MLGCLFFQDLQQPSYCNSLSHPSVQFLFCAKRQVVCRRRKQCPHPFQHLLQSLPVSSNKEARYFLYASCIATVDESDLK